MSLTLPRKGRGTALQPDPRYDAWQRSVADDGWPAQADEDAAPRLATTLFPLHAKRIITHNRSPDVPFEQSINPYKGCEHGCVYCFARPNHAYLGLSPGLDFETRIGWKPDAPAKLQEELAAPGYRCRPIALGIDTDAWQPVERTLGLTRQVLEILSATRHPVSIVTKSALIERDLDLLSDLARDGLVQVMISITTLDAELARRMEPRAATPSRRLLTVERLHRAGVPVGVLFAPLIPALNDHEMEAVLGAARAAGAQAAGYGLLRLPHELKDIFGDWLARHFPDRAGHVHSLLRQLRSGSLNDSRFGSRMHGEGVFAELYRQRLQRLIHKLGFVGMPRPLNTALFTPPAAAPTSGQLPLF